MHDSKKSAWLGPARVLTWDELRAELERKGLPVFRLGDCFELTEKGQIALEKARRHGFEGPPVALHKDPEDPGAA